MKSRDNFEPLTEEESADFARKVKEMIDSMTSEEKFDFFVMPLVYRDDCFNHSFANALFKKPFCVFKDKTAP